MFIGIAFHYLYKNQFKKTAAFSLICIFTCLFTLLSTELTKYQVAIGTQNYIMAVVIFAICYQFKARFHGNRITHFLANISYPLYVIHGILGYFLLNLLYRLHFSISSCLFITITLVISPAYLLHQTVELAAIHLGKKIIQLNTQSLLKKRSISLP